jgi:nucleoside-diphosphate-sugar epimerase
LIRRILVTGAGGFITQHLAPYQSAAAPLADALAALSRGEVA